MSDVFDRLKNSSRPSVPRRDASIVSPTNSNDENTERSHDEMTEFSHSDGSGSELSRRTIRLDPDIDRQLGDLCSLEKMTRETFLEAAFLELQENPGTLAKVIRHSQKRYLARKRAGERRKMETLTKKLKSDS